MPSRPLRNARHADREEQAVSAAAPQQWRERVGSPRRYFGFGSQRHRNSSSRGWWLQIRESAALRAVVQYEVANEDKIPNLGEQFFSVVTVEGTVRGMRPRVADVSKALQSVRALVKTGHVVVFRDGENCADHYIMNRMTGEVNAVLDDGLNYLMRLYAVPPVSQHIFPRQVGAC